MAETTGKTISSDVLAAFCETELFEYDLRTPWRDGGRVFATDGRILIELTDDPRPFGLTEGRRVVSTDRILSKLAEAPGEDAMEPVVSVPGPPDGANVRWERMVPCPYCANAEVWKAAGERPEATDDSDDCIECQNGWRFEDVRDEGGLVFYGEERFGGHYIWAIGQLPNARVALTQKGDLAFAFDGGRGMLCRRLRPGESNG